LNRSDGLNPGRAQLTNTLALFSSPARPLHNSYRVSGTISKMKRRLRLPLPAWRCLAQKLDPQRSSLTWRTRLLYALSGATHSALTRIQDLSYADALKAAVPSPPIFLLGFWRSGTTFLHELISCDPRFGFPSTYACLNPAHFLLTGEWIRKQEQPQSRCPMDDQRIPGCRAQCSQSPRLVTYRPVATSKSESGTRSGCNFAINIYTELQGLALLAHLKALLAPFRAALMKVRPRPRTSP
jgi:hypothetical protein